MRLRVTAEVKGDILLKEKISTQFYIYTFNVFKENESCFISVEKSVSNYIDDISKASFDESNHFVINIPETQTYADMVDWLKRIEAFGSFNIGIRKILYEEAEVTWIPETIEEEKILSIKSYKVTRGGQNSKYLRLSDFQDTLFYSKRIDKNYIPFSYFRLGASFFDEEEYYLSYINYFMMIEYLYGNGITDTKKLRIEFVKSDVLVLSILMAINTFPIGDLNLEWLKNECKKKQKEYNIEGLIFILVDHRGMIAHGSKRRSGMYRDNPNLLRPISFILGMICRYVCGYIQILSNMPKEQMNAFLKNRISEMKSMNNGAFM